MYLNNNEAYKNLMDVYSKEFVVDFKDVDKTEHLKMNALLDLMQETAREHSMLIKTDCIDQQELYHWVIVRAKLHLDVVPKLNDKIRMDTFEAGIENLFFIRRFEIYNEQCIGYIIGYYLLLNNINNRPVKLANAINIFNRPYEKYNGERLGKLVQDSDNIIREEHRKVYSSEIDINGHMNNVHYIRWSMDMYSTQELTDKPIRDIQIQYIKELKEDDTVHIIRTDTDYIVGKREDTPCFITKISR